MIFETLPINLHIELTNNCNAKCPMCSRTTNKIIRTQDICLDQLKNFCNDAIFSNINYCGNDGDPLMHKDILSIVNYFSRSNQIIHTNGSLRHPSFWKSLAKIPNLKVIFGIDGSTPETHQKYRVNTNFHTILKNASLFNSEGGSSWWQFIVFEHNKHQIEEAKRIARDCGFKVFEKLYSRRDDTAEIKIVRKKNILDSKLACKSLLKKEFYIRSDGELFPCVYHGSREKYSGLNIKHTKFRDLLDVEYFKTFNFNNSTCLFNCTGTNRNIREREAVYD